MTTELITLPKYLGRGAFEYIAVTADNEVVRTITNVTDVLLKVLEQEGPMTRQDLVIRTGIPRTTIYDGLIKLILPYPPSEAPRVRKVLAAPTRLRGRPKVLFEVIPQVP